MSGDANLRRFCGFFSFLCILLLVPASFSSAQQVGKDACLACHSIEGMQKSRGGKNVSLHVDAARFGNSVHGVFECVNCHSDIAALPHQTELNPPRL